MCIYDLAADHLSVCRLSADCAAFALDEKDRLIVSTADGVFRLNPDSSLHALYDNKITSIKGGNDMKVGPDGRLYVGTQSSRRLGLSDTLDGTLYSIDGNGTVRRLLDGMSLSNGMEWSMDEKRFYHTDSDTHTLCEYDYCKASGELCPTGRTLSVPGIDGFTIDTSDRLFAACWGKGHIAVIDTHEMKLLARIPLPCRIPASCAFVGKRMDILAVTTASFSSDISNDPNAGFCLLLTTNTKGREPFRYESHDHGYQALCHS